MEAKGLKSTKTPAALLVFISFGWIGEVKMAPEASVQDGIIIIWKNEESNMRPSICVELCINAQPVDGITHISLSAIRLIFC